MTVSELEEDLCIDQTCADCAPFRLLIADSLLMRTALQEIAKHGESAGDTIELRLAKANLSWNTAVHTLENLKVQL